ncbi:MAG TPA: NAD(P)/FAD-dependent oxidoreductase [Actinomycetota bacterium]|nr:NAD(P)/FAD-dependent oxidoreductase [Actinomycetota bacterium]
MAEYDAIVIGAGHNGLICSTYLARSGLKVLVLERSDRIGGACVTEELWPGFRVSTAAYALSLLLPEVVSELGLKLDVRPKDPMVFAPLDDGGGLMLWRDPAKRKDEIAKLSPRDAERYPEFISLFAEAATRLRPLLTFPATRKQVRRAFRASEVERLFKRTVDGSIAELCEEYFESDLLQGLMASQGIIGSAAGPRTPGTAYLYLHHAFGTAAGELGEWGLVRGGMGAITQELERVARAAGVEIKLNAAVAAVSLAGKRKVKGVALETGEEFAAPAVFSNADPKRTVALVERGALPPEFVEDVQLIPTDGTVVKVNCALSGLPRFTDMNGTSPGPEHTATITVSPSIDYLEEGARAAAEGRAAEAMFCEAWIQTASEPELAPPGKHTLSIFAQYAPYQLADGHWTTRREEIGDRVIATLERYAPGLSSLIEHRLVLGPPDLEERFGLTGGNIFHGELLPEWLFDRRPATGWHRHRTPLPGLYLCGSGAHPGGGVCGAPGRSAARAYLQDGVASGGYSP